MAFSSKYVMWKKFEKITYSSQNICSMLVKYQSLWMILFFMPFLSISMTCPNLWVIDDPTDLCYVLPIILKSDTKMLCNSQYVGTCIPTADSADSCTVHPLLNPPPSPARQLIDACPPSWNRLKRNRDSGVEKQEKESDWSFQLFRNLWACEYVSKYTRQYFATFLKCVSEIPHY